MGWTLICPKGLVGPGVIIGGILGGVFEGFSFTPSHGGSADF